MYETAADIGRFDEHEIEIGLFCKFLCEECLSASRRAVQQHAVWRSDAVLLCQFFVLDHEDHFLGQIVFQFLHAGDVGKAVTAASADLDRQIVVAVLSSPAFVSFAHAASAGVGAFASLLTAYGLLVIHDRQNVIHVLESVGRLQRQTFVQNGFYLGARAVRHLERMRLPVLPHLFESLFVVTGGSYIQLPWSRPCQHRV